MHKRDALMENKILVITGMHRSGTSMITQWLHRCGLPIGDRLLGALIGNEEGHFEDLDFMEFHTAVLEGQGMAGNGLSDKAVHALNAPDAQKLQQLIGAKNALHPQWGWKDPRTCLFLPVYRKMLPGALYLVILRDHASVVNSLVSRIYRTAEKKYLNRSPFSAWLWKNFRRHLRKRKLYRQHTEQYLRVWIAYNEEILEHIRQLPSGQYIMVDYKSLTQADQPVFSYLCDTWNFSLNYVGFKEIYKASLLNPPINLVPFVHDKSLFAKAHELEQSLRSMITRSL